MSEDRLETELHALLKQMVAGQSFGESPAAAARESRIALHRPVLTLRGAIRTISHTDSKPVSTPFTHYLDEDECSRKARRALAS